MGLCQIIDEHYLLKISGFGMNLSLITWHGVFTDSFCLCAQSVPNTFCLVRFLHLAWACHRHDLTLFQDWAKHVLLIKICTLGVDLGLTPYYFVPNMRQTVTDWYNIDTWSRCGTTLGQSCFHRNLLIGQGLDLCHLAHLGQTGGRVRDKLNSF